MALSDTLVRIFALIYAGVVFMFLAAVAASIAVSSPDAWRKAVTITACALTVPLIPFAALALGNRFVVSFGAGQILRWSVAAACVLPVLVALALTTSGEPLGMLALLYVPPVQIAGLAVALLLARMFNSG